MAGYMQKYERVLNALKESDHRLNQKLFNDTDDAFQVIEMIYDETGKPVDGIIKKANKNVGKILNLKMEGFIGKRIREAFPTTESFWFKEWNQVLQSGKASHRPDYQGESNHWLDVFSFPYSEGQIGIIYREITPSMIVDQYKRFQALTIATTELIFQMNPDWSEMTQLNNPGFLKDTPEVDNGWLDSYIPSVEQELVLSNIREAVKNKKIFELEHRVNCRNGSIGWVHSRAVPLLDHNGEITEWFGASNDITKRKTAEEELIKRHHELKRIVEMKDEFLSIISHEFKTPLNVIFSAIQIMEHRCFNELSTKGKDLLFKIKQNAFRQMRLVNNLLDITRVNAGSMKMKLSNKDIVCFTRAITESVEVYAKQKHISIDFSSAMKKKIIAVDEEFYERILLNLLSNAIKFTEKGKSIQVRLFPKKCHKNPMICLQVIDQGLGIPADKTNTIFERFGQVDSRLTRQAEGTGIGLSLVKMLVELLGGKITLESEPGIGSTFSVLFPDKTVKENAEKSQDTLYNDRLIHSIQVEFSDIYLRH